MRLFVQDKETAPERGRGPSEVTEHLLHKHFIPDLSEMIAKQTAPASGVWAKTRVWQALPSRTVTRGLIDEADDTWKASATVATVSPAAP